jgi:hypothetical protein
MSVWFKADDFHMTNRDTHNVDDIVIDAVRAMRYFAILWVFARNETFIDGRSANDGSSTVVIIIKQKLNEESRISRITRTLR